MSSKYQIAQIDNIERGKRWGLFQSTAPAPSHSVTNPGGLRFIASSSRNITVNNLNNNALHNTKTVTNPQSLNCFNKQPNIHDSYRHRYFKPWKVISRSSSSAIKQAPPQAPKSMNVFQCLKFIYLTEGVFGLWKGLGPNLMGVAPSRAIYFWAYSTSKKNINAVLPRKNRDTPFVHVVSAMSAGFSASTTTNPIWLIKTRLQLDRATSKNRLTVKNSIIAIYKEGVSIWSILNILVLRYYQ